MMDGMTVWARFSDGSIHTAVWADTGVGSGGASAPGWFNIWESGDTFSSEWSIANVHFSPVGIVTLNSFGLFGPTGDVVFDRTSPSPGTTGSASGRDLDMQAPYDATVTYSDIVNLTGFGAVGDLYASVRVDFDKGSELRPDFVAHFFQDTDNAATKGSITPVPEVATTSVLLGLGLLGIAGARRRLS
jgi:hypothetical protein